jgi:hypothetical protein
MSEALSVLRFVLPAASFYSFNKAVGIEAAAVVFGVGFILPRRWMVMFLQGFFASRSLMRELLDPYFSRVRFTKDQRKKWFRDREGLLFGESQPLRESFFREASKVWARTRGRLTYSYKALEWASISSSRHLFLGF